MSHMDFNMVEPFLLEIICLIGLSMGTENKYFKAIFARKPWLFGEIPPQFQHVKNFERKKVPAKIFELYSLDSYIKKVVTLGKILIRNHETLLFEEFFFSQNCMYMSDGIVSALIQESLVYLVPDCCLPIFALCSADFKLCLEDFDKKLIDYQSNKSAKTVNEVQL